MGIALFALLVVSLSSWFLVKHEELKATQSPKMSDRTVYNIPEPAKINTINLGDNYSFLQDAGQVTQNIVNQNNVPNTPLGTYVWNNVVQMVEQNELGQGLIRQKGALWYNDQISIEKGFKGEFETYLGNQNKVVYDGISFTLQNDPAGLQAIGANGDGFGTSANIVFPDSYIKNAISIVIDAGDNSIYAVVPKAGRFGFGVRSLIRYNYHKLNISDFGWLSNGVWQHLSYEWDAQEELFLYTVTFKNTRGDTRQFTDSINLQTGATSSNWVDTRSTQETYPPEHPGPKNIEEIVSKPGANNYFGGELLYWGFTGTSLGSGTQETDGSSAIAPLVSVELTPNQSQSPLVLSMTKLGELNSSNERQPLVGATFILQAKNQEGKWQQFDPEPSKNIPKTFKTGSDGKIKIQATNGQGEANLIEMVLKYGGLDDYQEFRFREVEAPTGYIQPPVISPMNPNDYAASESEHSAGLFSSKSVELSGASTTPSNPTPENPDDGDFGEVYNNTPPTIELTKSGVENAPLPGVEMTIGAKVTDKSDQQKVISLAQLANKVKGTTTYSDITLTTNEFGKITLPTDQIPLMLDLASSSLDVYRSLDQWVFIETKVATGYQPSPFLDGNWQEVPEAYKNKFIFNITDNWTSAEDIKSEYPVTAANALNQFTISPEAIGPEDEPLADASFTINDTPISNPYALTVGTAASAPTYTLKQTNTNDGYASAQPVTFKLVQTPNKINEFTVTTVTVEGNNTDNYFEFYYKVGEEKKSITPGTPFTSSDFLENPTLFLSLVNQPIGDFALAQIKPLNYGSISLPQKNPDELIKRQDADWKVQFTDTRLDAYRTPLKLSVKLDQNFTNTNDPTKTISGILLYRPEETTAITPDTFLIEGEETPIKEKINPESGTNYIDWPEQAGFLLQIDTEKQTKIFAGDYQAELTFILSEDPL